MPSHRHNRRAGSPAIDETAVSELDLYADNTAELHPQHQAIIANIKRKIENGKYNASLAPKMWAYWYESAAKRYVKEFASPGDWSRMFPKALRDHCAKQKAIYEYRRIMNGEYGNLVRR